MADNEVFEQGFSSYLISIQKWPLSVGSVKVFDRFFYSAKF